MVIQNERFFMSPYAIPGLKDRSGITHMINRNIIPSDIVNSVCEYFKIKEDDIKKKSRRRNHVYPRQCAMYLIKKYTTLTLVEIGQEFKYGINKTRRDHTTVLHSINTLNDLMDTEEDVTHDIKQLTEMISSGMGLKTLKETYNEI